jgi:hypothetical protein
MDNFAKLLKENAVLPLWPDGRPNTRTKARGDLCSGSVG